MKAVRTMYRVKEQIANGQPDPNPTGIYGHQWLLNDAADTVTRLWYVMSENQREAAQRFQREAQAILDRR